MKRKVIQIAESTQLISLPRKWAQLHNIKKGDELEITEEGKSLKVSTDRGLELEKANIKIKNPAHFMKRSISSLYKLGYDEIEVSFDDAKVIDLIQSEITELLGFEIVNQSERSCTLKNIAPGLDTEFDSILRRIFLMNLSMANDSYEAISKSDFERLDDIMKVEATNNKLTNFCERMLNKKGYKDYNKVNIVYSIVVSLERVADELRDLCDYVYRNQKIKIGKDTLDIYKGCVELIDLFQQLFYNYDLDKMFAMKEKRINLETKAFNILTKNKEDSILLHYMIALIQLVHHMTEGLS